MLRLISQFIGDESGATAIEYALIAAGISMAIIVTVRGLGTTLSGRYAAVNASLK
ncbi:MAG: putative Flp/Fap pilin component [Tardiphaga sp.]|nr:putative Flp/Fap pilin component [Tardiphaga sp.]